MGRMKEQGAYGAARKSGQLNQTLLPHFEAILNVLMTEPADQQQSANWGYSFAGVNLGKQYRYGTKNGLSVNVDMGTWNDFDPDRKAQWSQLGIRGNIVGLIMYPHDCKKLFIEGCTYQEALKWCHDNGWLPLSYADPPEQIEYVYVDKDGKPVHRVLAFRFKNKKKAFKQQRFENGEWIDGMDGVQRLLYRLPQLIQGITDQSRIWIAEGEKCVECVAKLGEIATCSPEGAGILWSEQEHSHFPRFLIGAKQVVILQDNDKAGEIFAYEAAHSLARIVGDIRILLLPGLEPKGDVADWLDAGGTQAQLNTLADQVPVWDDNKYESQIWHNQLILDKKGQSILPLETNAYLLTVNHPDTKGLYRFNTFSGKGELARKPEWYSSDCQFTKPRALMHEDYTEYQRWLQREFNGLRLNLVQLRFVLRDVARLNEVNPLQDWINELLTWNDIEEDIFERALSEGMPSAIKKLVKDKNGKEIDLNVVFLRKMFIGLVARIMEPGCKNDVMLVLIGPEDIGKSVWWEIIASPEYFVTHLPPVAKYESLVRRIKGKLIGEMSEMHSIRDMNEETYKSVISTGTDVYEPKYEEDAKEFPRQGIFGGSSNDTGIGLYKGTENRRFNTIEFVSGEIIHKWFQDNRNMLFAVAARAWQSDESWWLDEGWMKQGRNEVNAKFIQVLPQQEIVATYVAGLQKVFYSDVEWLVSSSVSRGINGVSVQFNTRPNKIIGKIMKNLGFEPDRERVGGKRPRIYVRSNPNSVDPNGNLFENVREFLSAWADGSGKF